MPATDQRWINGALPEPADRYRCFIFDAIAAIATAVLPEAFTAGAGALGAGAAAGAADIGAGALGAGALAGGAADIALPAISVVGGLAPEAAGAAGIGADLAAPALAGAAGLTAAAPAIADVVGGGAGAGTSPDLGTGFSGGSGLANAFSAGSDPTAPLTSTPHAAPLSTQTNVPSLGGGGAVSGAGGSGSPAAPASIGPTSPTSTGIGLGGDTPNVDFGFSGSQTAVPNTGEDFGGGGDATTGASHGGITSRISGGLDKALGSLTGGNVDTKDLGTLLSAGGFGYNILNRNKTLPGQADISKAASGLTATAQGQAAQGAQLEGYLASGTLPPGLSAGIKQAVDAAHASIKSGYAARGESGSSAEAQDIQNANDRAMAASQQVALQLLQQGSTMVGQSASTEGMAAQLYQSIMADALSRDNALGSSIGNFAGALAGSSGAGGNSITLKAA